MDNPRSDLSPRKGRGAISNPAGRFETRDRPLDPGAAPARPRTEVREERARKAIARNESPDIPFDRSVNPYRGCEHGCVYCFARPTHSYLGLSPGLDFETILTAKTNAAEALAAELRAPRYRCAPLALGANTDPYQPIERECRITRDILETLAAFRHPFVIITKSGLVQRDIDVIAPESTAGRAAVLISITTLDNRLAAAMEPRASAPAKRIEAISALAAAGVRVGVLAAPVIPAINDHEIEAILEASAAAGARSAGWVLLRTPYEIEALVAEWMVAHHPHRAARHRSLMAQMRPSQAQKTDFHKRMRGSGPIAQSYAARFRAACRRLGLEHRAARNGGGATDAFDLDCSAFAPPPAPGDQLTLI